MTYKKVIRNRQELTDLSNRYYVARVDDSQVIEGRDGRRECSFVPVPFPLLYHTCSLPIGSLAREFRRLATGSYVALARPLARPHFGEDTGTNNKKIYFGL